ncbi:MAG: hypothetical protein GMKNLPBB_03125 [Myxococcota bacterium]|nr:hypothetical protein [Myxococcota bacterium]
MIVPNGVSPRDTASSRRRKTPEDVIVREDLARNIARIRESPLPLQVLKSSLRLLTLDGYRGELNRLDRITGFRMALMLNFERNTRAIEESVRTLAREESARGPVLFYCYWTDQAALAALRMRDMLRSMGARSCAIARTHNADLFDYDFVVPGGYQPFQWNIVWNLDKIYPDSAVGADYLIRRWGLNPGRIEVNRLAARKRPDEILSRPSNDGVFRVVSVSYIANYKRVNLIARVLKKVNRPIEWTHIGDGDDRPLVEQEIASSPGHFKARLTGMMPNPEIYRYYSENPVDLFINLSDTEGLPLAVAEAQSFGIPVLATPAGGMSELVNEKTGWILPSIDVDEEAAARLIESIIDMPPESREARRVAARESWRENSNPDRNYERFADSLLEVMGS